MTGLVRMSILLLLGLLAMHPSQAEDWQLRLFTEEYPPITYSSEGRASGIGTAIVTEVMRRAGIKSSIEVMPWARAYRAASTTKNAGLFVTARTPQREALFHWIGPLVRTQGILYGRRNEPISITTLADAERVEKIAVPREWYLQKILEAGGLKNLHTVATPHKALQMLQAGRVSLAAIDDVNLQMTAKEVGIEATEFVPRYRIAESQQYLALSIGTSPAIVHACRQAFESMKLDGTLVQLYRRWLPEISVP